MINEWLVVTVTAGLAGAVRTFVSEGYSTIRHEPKRKTGEWILDILPVLFRNTLGGSVASFILWATYTSSITFKSTMYTPSEVAASIIVGLGGAQALSSYVNEQSAKEWEQVAENNAAAAKTLDEASKSSFDDKSQDAHTPNGGPNHGTGT